VVRRWLSRADVLERSATDGWDEGFVQELIGEGGPRISRMDTNGRGKEGESAFDEMDQTRVADGVEHSDIRKGLFEVLYVYQRAANEDGIPGIYVTVMSGLCETPATEMRLFDRAHGLYPFVAFAREYLSARLTDTRGVPELAMSQQNMAKLIKDSVADHVQVTVNPPKLVPKGSTRFTQGDTPFGEIPVGPRDRYEYMQRPAYPAAAEWVQKDLRMEHNQYWGRATEDVPETLRLTLQQRRVDRFLASVKDCLMMAWQCIQEKMPAERLQRIAGGQGLPVARDPAEIQGKYDLMLSYDVRDMDLEYVTRKAEVVLKYIRPIDAKATVQYERVAARILQSVDPNWAEEAILPEQVAEEREARETQNALVLMLNGSRPPMPEGGINAGLRRQVLEGELQQREQNPGAYPPVAPASRMLIEEYLKYLEFMEQQVANAETGRVGVDTEKTDREIAGAQGARPRTTTRGA